MRNCKAKCWNITISYYLLALTCHCLASPFPFFPSTNLKPCGRHQASSVNHREAKIVGGYYAEQGEFPWMVSFKAKHGHFCGGAVISDSYIISAAHCFHQNKYLEYSMDGSINLESLNATLGEYSLKNSKEKSELVMNLKRIYLHPKYDPVSKQNDIALIKLSKTISNAANVEPVCLPGKSDDAMWEKDNQATVLGWGMTHFNQDYYDWKEEVDYLRKVDVKIWDREVCKEKYKGFTRFPSVSFLCAGEQGKESCTGDSGGPLLRLNQQKKWVVIGIVANGNRCGATGRPGIYTLVSDFSKWIESYT